MKRIENPFFIINKLVVSLMLLAMVIFLTRYPQDTSFSKYKSVPIHFDPPAFDFPQPLIQNAATAFLGNSTNDPSQSYSLDITKMINRNPFLKNVTTTVKGKTCFNVGTDYQKSQSSCICFSHFHGEHCSIPSSIFKHQGYGADRFSLRANPRRVIMGVVLNHELELLEVRIRQLHHVVDIFVIQESNITTGGDPKKLIVLNALREGFLKEFHWKLLYVYLDHFPPGYIKDGWKADGFLRQHMSTQSLTRVQGTKGEDLFLSFDADEIPNPEVVDFLRWHNGYPEPFVFNLVWTLYGFYWRMPSYAAQKALTSIVGGSSVQFLKKFADRDVFKLRSRAYARHPLFRPQSPLQVGSISDPGGFHCSWCFSPEGIRIKLLSAQRADLPRWGDYPEKTRISYIHNLVRTGGWFDGSTTSFKRTRSSDLSNFAPPFIMANQKRYQHLLRHPDELNAAESWRSPLDGYFI